MLVLKCSILLSFVINEASGIASVNRGNVHTSARTSILRDYDFGPHPYDLLRELLIGF